MNKKIMKLTVPEDVFEYFQKQSDLSGFDKSYLVTQVLQAHIKGAAAPLPYSAILAQFGNSL
ncbi:hypothetical protein ACFSR7_36140 [Cohnella sp. GCM10020058]|uniref:hypothetical protein n=1 Tax=Cohnella sp. GCM10020058 TaxID=3317330 RepID=UPI003643536C